MSYSELGWYLGCFMIGLSVGNNWTDTLFALLGVFVLYVSHCEEEAPMARE